MDPKRPIGGRPHSLIASAVGTVRLVHPFPAFVVVVTSVLFVLVAHMGSPGLSVLLRAAGVVGMSQIMVGATNDYVDRERDACGQRDKPIPTGLATPLRAIILATVSGLVFVPLAASFGPVPFVVASIGACGGLAYDLWLKPTIFSAAGYLISFLCLITWIWLIAGKITLWFLLIYPAAALTVFVAHLAQSLPDIETDAEVGNRGVAVFLGPAITFQLIAALTVIIAATGVLLAIASSTPVSIACSVAALVELSTALILNRNCPIDRRDRERLFYLLAPGIALVGFACLLAINSLQ